MEFTIKAEMLLHDGYTPRVDDAWNQLAMQLHETREKRKTLELEEKFLLNKLVLLSNNKISCSNAFCLQLITKAGTIQYKSIPELQNVDLDTYRSAPTSYWSLKEL